MLAYKYCMKCKTNYVFICCCDWFVPPKDAACAIHVVLMGGCREIASCPGCKYNFGKGKSWTCLANKDKKDESDDS